MRRVPITVLAILAAMQLSACDSWFGEAESPPLPGKRVPVLTFQEGLEADPRIASLKVTLPKPTRNADWPQSGGRPSHAMQHLAVPGDLAEAWVAGIGTGSGVQTQLLAEPIVAAGRIYTLDVDAELRAFDAATGDLLWAYALKTGDAERGILGGGLALDGGRIFVTTGFAEVIALDAAKGEVLWRREVSGPMRAAPTVHQDRVFAITIANELHALSAADGSILWSHVGITETATLLGGAAPAAGGGIVIAPYSSGEVVALRVENGRVVWSDSLTALRRTDAVSALPHIRGRPVIDRGRVFVISHSGRLVAIDVRTGNRIWEKPVGGTQAPWVAGDFVYVLSSSAQLICLSRRDGRIKWIRKLQQFGDEKEKQNPIQWSGPVLAGGRLLVSGSNGELWSVSPYTGKPLGKIDIDGGVLLNPVVANGTVYVLTDFADLIAFR